jgi:hypothetical protein
MPACLLGRKGVDAKEIAKCEATNWRESVVTVLTAYQWRGGAVACVGLALSADNRKVHEGTLITRDKLDTTGFMVEAKHIWQKAAAGTMLTIQLEGRVSIYERWVVFRLCV